jgi:hypothetical protein
VLLATDALRGKHNLLGSPLLVNYDLRGSK